LAREAAMSRFVVAVWLGIRAPTLLCRPADLPHVAPHLTVGDFEASPHGGQPVEMEVDRAVAEVVSPRQWHVHLAATGQEEPQHDDRRPHALYQLVRGHRPEILRPRRGHGQITVGQAQHLGPTARSTSAMESTSSMTGTLLSTVRPSANSRPPSASARSSWLLPPERSRSTGRWAAPLSLARPQVSLLGRARAAHSRCLTN